MVTMISDHIKEEFDGGELMNNTPKKQNATIHMEIVWGEINDNHSSKRGGFGQRIVSMKGGEQHSVQVCVLRDGCVVG